MKRVLVTGASGFIAHHLVAYLLDYTDCHVVALDRLDVSSSLGRLVDILEGRDRRRVTFVYHDLKAEINLITAERIGSVEYVFHLGASSHVDRSIVDPVGFIQDNVVGTAHLMNWARKLPNLSVFFNFSTDEVFGPAPEGVFYTENDRHCPSNPYAASKSGADQVGHAFYVTYALPVITTYTINVFGERQSTEKFVSKAIRATLNNEILDIHCSLNDSGPPDIGSRFWIDVKDICLALGHLVSYGSVGEAYNIVGPKELNNLEIANIVGEILNKPVRTRFVDYREARPGYDRRYALSGTKMEGIGWRARPLEDSFPRVVQWMANHPEWL